MKSRSRSLRAILATVMVVVTGMSMLLAGALAVMTTELRSGSAEVASAMRNIGLADEAEIALLLHSRGLDPLARQGLERTLREKLVDARRYVTSSDEQVILVDAEAGVEAYLAASSRSGAGATENDALRSSAFEALEDLVAINASQADEAGRRAALLDRVADIVGVSVGLIVLVLTGGLLWWLRGRAFMPIWEVAAAMERFGGGDQQSRATETGSTELREVAAQFNKMADALVSQRNRRMTFLSGVAHDLRNPLSALAMSAGTVQPGEALPPEPHIRRTFETFRRQVAFLDRMVGDLLDMASIEAGKLDLKTEELDLRAVVRDVVELFASSSSRHVVEMSLPESPIRIIGDPARLAQVLTNLMTNAIRYSPDDGKVTVTAAIREEEAFVSVSDEGIGIAREDLKHIFEPFRHALQPRRESEAKGLGLFIVRRIVEAQQGSIDVTSTPGRGSTFTVRLSAVAQPTTTRTSSTQNAASTR